MMTVNLAMAHQTAAPTHPNKSFLVASLRSLPEGFTASFLSLTAAFGLWVIILSASSETALSMTATFRRKSSLGAWSQLPLDTITACLSNPTAACGQWAIMFTDNLETDSTIVLRRFPKRL